MFNCNQEKIYYVYSYSTPEGEIFYIGKGKNNRLYSHLWEAKKKKLKGRINYPKVHKIREILRDGKQPLITKIAENLSEKEAFDLEKKLILEIGRCDLGTGTLLNLTEGGEGASGKVFSEKTKQKISKANKGKKRSIESRKNLCIPKSDETKKKMSESKKKKIRQLDKNNNLIKEWNSIMEATNELEKQGIYVKNISACCRGFRKTCGGFKWEFI